MEPNSVKQRGGSVAGSQGARGAPKAEQGQREEPAKRKKSGPSSHWTLMVLFLSLVLDLLGFTVILPLIPSLLEYYGRNDQVPPAS